MKTPVDSVLPRPSPSVSDPFREFHPVKWSPQSASGVQQQIHSIKRNHGVSGSYRLHNLNDEINDDRPVSQKIIVEYCINGSSYILFTVADLLNSSYPFDRQSEGNILGEIGERDGKSLAG